MATQTELSTLPRQELLLTRTWVCLSPHTERCQPRGQVGVNRSALSAYGTLRRMSSFPRLNKIAQMRPCLSMALRLIVLWPPNPAIARPLLHWLRERVSLGQTNENPGSRYIKVVAAKEHASEMSWEPDQVLGPPRQTSGPPHHDLRYLPLFDEAELDNYFAWLKNGAQFEKSVSLLGER